MAIGVGLAINFMDIEYRLSGGAANSDPSLSLGGALSSTRILSQSGTGIANITGVTFVDGVGNPASAGTLNYTNVGQTLEWTPNGGTIGTAVDVSADGRYGIPNSTDNQYIVVDVVSASLPVADQSDAVIIANLFNLLWDDISKAESNVGDSEYRCIYVINPHATDTGLGGGLFISANTPGADTITIALDPAGLNGTPAAIVDEGTAPVGPVFTGPTGPPGLTVGDLGPGDSYPIWMNRVVLVNTSVAEPNNNFLLGLEMGF